MLHGDDFETVEAGLNLAAIILLGRDEVIKRISLRSALACEMLY